MKKKYFHELSNDIINNIEELKKLDINDYKEPAWCELPLEDGCMSLFNGYVKKRVNCIFCEYYKGDYRLEHIEYLRNKEREIRKKERESYFDSLDI